MQERKEMLGLIIKQIALTPIEQPKRQTQIKMLWYTGAISELVAERPTTKQRLQTPEAVVQKVRDVAFAKTDEEIAQILNDQGLVS